MRHCYFNSIDDVNSCLNLFSGLFPDVGGSFFLPRLQGKLGYYLGLTGFRLKGKPTPFENYNFHFHWLIKWLNLGPDVFHAGVATHYCESAKIPELEAALLSSKNTDNVANVLNDLCPKPQTEFVLAKHLDQINKSFAAPSMEGILNNLEKDNSEWAKQTIKVFSFYIFLNSSISQYICMFCRLCEQFRQPVWK